MRTTVVPDSASPRRVDSSAAPVTGSRPDVGSSRKSTRGRVSNSAAMHARLRSPPLSARTGVSARCASPRTSNTSVTRAATVSPGIRSRPAYSSVRRNGSSRWMTSSCGTNPNSGPGDPGWAPSCRTSPEAGAWSPARVCNSTVLPAPLLPAMTTRRPAPTSNDTSSNTRPAPRTSCVTARNSSCRPVTCAVSGGIGVGMGAACHPGVSHTVARGGSVSRIWPSSGLTGSGFLTSLPP